MKRNLVVKKKAVCRIETDRFLFRGIDGNVSSVRQGTGRNTIKVKTG